MPTRRSNRLPRRMSLCGQQLRQTAPRSHRRRGRAHRSRAGRRHRRSRCSPASARPRSQASPTRTSRSADMRESSPRTPGAAITQRVRRPAVARGSRTRRPLPHPARTLKERREGDGERGARLSAHSAFGATAVAESRRRRAGKGSASRPDAPTGRRYSRVARAEHRHRCARPADGGRQDQLERTMVRERVGRRERLVAESLTDDVDEAPFRSRRSAVRADGQEQRERDRYRQCMPHVFLLVAKMSRP